MGFFDNLAERFDGGKTFKFSDVEMLVRSDAWISTGSPSLDYHMQTYGYPSGIIEVRGESQSGKTTFSLQAMKCAQKQYGERAIIVILSSERRDNKAYARQMGVNTDLVIIHKVTTIEDVFNRIFQTVEAVNEQLLQEFKNDGKAEKIRVNTPEMAEYISKRLEEFGKPRLFFVWDALGQTVSSQELAKAKQNAKENATNKAALASAARALSGGLRSIIALQDEEDFTLYIINRPYDKTDGRPGKKSYGGKAITLYPTIRLELARIQGVKVGDEEVGQITQVHLLKTDYARPKQKFNIEIAYGLGIVLSSEDIAYGIKKKVLTKFGAHGASFKMGKKEMKWKSKKGLYELYENQDKMLGILISKLTKLRHNDVEAEYKAKQDKWK